MHAFVWLVALLIVLSLPGTASGQLADPCPEPNDAIQAACFLGPGADAIGVLSHRDDIDTYRFDVVDFNALVRLELIESPSSYRMTVVNWNGDQMAVSQRRGDVAVVEVLPPSPGAYFVLVDSDIGQVNPGQPYRLRERPRYTGRAPQVVFSGDFRPGARENLTTSDETADYVTDHGKVTIAMKVGGDSEEGSDTPSIMMDPEVPPVGTFMMVVDAKVIGGSDVAYQVLFRADDRWKGDEDYNRYFLTVRPGQRMFALNSIIESENTVLVDWTEDDAINPAGVNRTVIRFEGDELTVYINGKEVLNIADDGQASGTVGFGLITWADPATVSFDNLLVVVPARR
jgi:hypothetical protein